MFADLYLAFFLCVVFTGLVLVNSNKKPKTYRLSVTTKTYEFLEVLAKNEGLTVSQYVEKCIEEEINKV